MQSSETQKSIWIDTFYAGQLIVPENFHEQPVFGSELALLEVFSRIGAKIPVTVFILKPAGYKFEKYNITWRSQSDWNTLVKTSPPSHIVISRYIGAMIDHIMPSTCKIFLWLHDVYPHPSWRGIQLKEHFVENMSRRLSRIITVGDAQCLEVLFPHYKIPQSLYTTIKNGITPVLGDNVLRTGTNAEAFLSSGLAFATEIPSHITRKRAPMSFVYSSGPDRGLWGLLDMWPAIVNKWPYATLQIFHGLEKKDFQRIEKLNLQRVFPMGKVTQQTLFDKLKYIDYWLYPCSFFETCCTTLIEMQYHGIICITSKIGALKENNNGIIIGNDENFGEDAFNTLIMLEENPEKKEEIRRRQYLWARDQTWDKRADEWLNVLNS